MQFDVIIEEARLAWRVYADDGKHYGATVAIADDGITDDVLKRFASTLLFFATEPEFREQSEIGGN